MNITKDKIYLTRNGFKVHVLWTEVRGGETPIIGLLRLEHKDLAVDTVLFYYPDGRREKDKETSFDLVEGLNE